MGPYKIYYARLEWKGCEDERPWVIIDKRGENVFGCFPISGQDLGTPFCFEIEDSHSGFEGTGLTKSCRVHCASIIEIKRDQFLRCKGELLGELLEQFLQEAGLS